MQEKYYKYAKLLLEKGLCLKKNQPLLIMAPVEGIAFVRVLTEVACKMGVTDIYYDWCDSELEHTSLKYLNEEAIKNSNFWNKEIHNEYAKKNAAFLFLVDSNPSIMNDIDGNKLKVSHEHSILTRNIYRDMQEDNKIDWCIAGIATEAWSKTIFKDDANSKEKLWNLIFDICLINEEDPCLAWTNKMKTNKEICCKLNNLNIKELHYKNSLGTDLYITLDNKALWCGGSSLINGEEPIVNIPTEEVFTTPNKFKTNGVVYTSLPLIHGGVTIEDIKLEFKDGKVINYDAKKGLDELKNILTMDSESSMLGEVALVDKSSPIAKSNAIFYETLYDENASCHIALGRGFKECLKDGENLNDEELEHIGYDKSKNHVDIMIGTNDLTIEALTYDNKEITIFKNGSFNL